MESGADVPLEAVGVALNRVLVPGISPSDSVVVLFPGDEGFIRRLSFPFKDRSRIAEVLPIELGGTLPTGLEVSLHTNFERTGPDSMDVIAVGVQQNSFAAYLEKQKADGLDPDRVGMESVELAALLPYLAAGEDGGRNLMVIWVEDELVEIMISSGASVVFCRAVRLDSPIFKNGDIGMAFMREVLLSTAAASEAGAPVNQVYVAGKDAVIIAGILSESLGMDCSVLNPAMIGIPGSENCSNLDTGMTRVVALAVGAAAGSVPGSLNLRMGAFGSEGASGLLREKAGLFIVSAILFAVLGVGWAGVRYAGLLSDRTAIETELRDFSATIIEQEVESFEDAVRTVRYGAREELALFPNWTGVGTLEKITRALVASGPAGSKVTPAADENAEAEEVIPADPGYAMELESVRVEPKLASFKGEAESIEKVDELINRLKSDVCFHEIVTESTERIQFQRHQGWQRFSVRMNVDCADKSQKKGARDAAVETREEASETEE
jgi:hypothetical protein